jgi:hypothetical protein
MGKASPADLFLGGRGLAGTCATGNRTPDNGGGPEALLPARQRGLSLGDHAGDAKETWTRGLEAQCEGGDETDSGAIDKPNMECGPKATAGIDRVTEGGGAGMVAGAEDWN